MPMLVCPWQLGVVQQHGLGEVGAAGGQQWMRAYCSLQGMQPLLGSPCRLWCSRLSTRSSSRRLPQVGVLCPHLQQQGEGLPALQELL